MYQQGNPNQDNKKTSSHTNKNDTYQKYWGQSVLMRP